MKKARLHPPLRIVDNNAKLVKLLFLIISIFASTFSIL